MQKKILFNSAGLIFVLSSPIFAVKYAFWLIVGYLVPYWLFGWLWPAGCSYDRESNDFIYSYLRKKGKEANSHNGQNCCCWGP